LVALSYPGESYAAIGYLTKEQEPPKEPAMGLNRSPFGVVANNKPSVYSTKLSNSVGEFFSRQQKHGVGIISKVGHQG